MAKGAQASEDQVAFFYAKLATLCAAAKVSGVVLTIDLIPLKPFAQGNYRMAPEARAVWCNTDPVPQPA